MALKAISARALASFGFALERVLETLPFGSNRVQYACSPKVWPLRRRRQWISMTFHASTDCYHCLESLSHEKGPLILR